MNKIPSLRAICAAAREERQRQLLLCHLCRHLLKVAESSAMQIYRVFNADVSRWFDLPIAKTLLDEAKLLRHYSLTQRREGIAYITLIEFDPIESFDLGGKKLTLRLVWSEQAPSEAHTHEQQLIAALQLASADAEALRPYTESPAPLEGAARRAQVEAERLTKELQTFSESLPAVVADLFLPQMKVNYIQIDNRL